MKPFVKHWTAFALLAAGGLGMGGFSATANDNPPPSRYEYAQPHMGTTFRLVFYAKTDELATRASEAAFGRIRQIDQRLSDYRNDSELNRLSRTAPSKEAIPVSDDLWKVLSHAQKVSCATDGAFDVTVGPLTKSWRRARRRREMPSTDRLTTARAAVGYKALELNAKTRTAKLLRPGMRLDLGGIAKGYAADEALRQLEALGIPRAMIDAGGDVVLGDPPPGRSGWRIGIAPIHPNAAPSRTLQLARAAVATSGDVWQHVTIDNVRYSHIIDPATGIGLTTPSSVTVIARDGMTADALASAISVLGPKRGIAHIETIPNTAALIVIADISGQGTTQNHTSKRFEQYTTKQPQD